MQWAGKKGRERGSDDESKNFALINLIINLVETTRRRGEERARGGKTNIIRVEKRVL